MQKGRGLSALNWERERLVDRVRFLFCSRAYKRRFAARAAQHGIFFSSVQFSGGEPSRRFLFAAARVAMLLVVAWLGAPLYDARLRNQTMAVELGALRQRLDQRQPPPAAQPTPRTPEVRIFRENADGGSL